MFLKDCEQCGRIFAAEEGQTLCKKCLEAEVESDFKKVRDYLYDNPGADIIEVEKETGVDRKIILKLLKDERIEVVNEESSILTCEVCGKQIKSGRMCDQCKKNKTIKELRNVANEIKSELEPKKKEKEIKRKGVGVTFHSRQ